MKNFLFAALFIVIGVSTVKAQTYYGSIDRFTVNSGWNVVPGSSSTTINFTVKVIRELYATGNWNWKPFNMNFKVGLVLAPGTALIEYLSPVYNVNSSNFGQYDSNYEATFSFSVPSSKLLDDYHLVLFYNIPNAGSTSYNQFSSYYAQINNPPPGPTFDPTHLTKIQSMGFSTTGIVDFNSTHYLVEGDVLIKKSSLNVSNPTYSVNNDKEHNINVWVKSAIKPANPNWDNAVSLAVAAWNANPSSDIKLHLVYQYGTLDVPPPYDIIVDADLGALSSSQPKAVEYPNGDGKPGGIILVNLDYNHSSSNQLTNNMIHAFGHVLGFKHNNITNSIMVNNNLSGYTNTFPSTIDDSVISSLYPLNVNSIVTPYISGIANMSSNWGWGQDYDMSYFVLGNTYTWTSNTPHPYLPFVGQSTLPEWNFNVGSHELKCTTSQSKYATPIIATKNINVQ